MIALLLKIEFSQASLFGTVMTLYILVFALAIGVFMLYHRVSEGRQTDREERAKLVAHINQLHAELTELRARLDGRTDA